MKLILVIRYFKVTAVYKVKYKLFYALTPQAP